jgi:predicted RND superfamily exporter protein
LKTFVSALATVVRRAPWLVVVATIVVTGILGSFAAEFQPAEDQNEAFAPDAPELAAASQIAATFGSTSRMQVLTSSETGDVITLDALLGVSAMNESVRSGDGSQYLVDQSQSPAILSFLAPVRFAIDAGAPAPTNDAEVKALYAAGMAQMPADFQSFMTALVSDEFDPDTVTAELGLNVITYEATDDFDELAARAQAIATAVEAAPTPESITLESFNQELIFATSDDFQTEVARLLAAAALIILLVLATIFVVRPGNGRDRLFNGIGLALMAVGAGIVAAPGLALIFPAVLPAAWAEAGVGTVLRIGALFYVASFLLWTVGSRRLRRTTADTLLTFLTIGFAIQWMNGYGRLRFEDASQMAQILPILLIGLGVDYSIHMTARYRQELHNGKSVDASVSTAIRTVGIALVLATVTTAVGFLTNVFNELPALAEFGELAAVGIAASFLLMLTFVPAVRELLDRRAERNGRLDTGGLEAGESRVLPKLIGKTSVLPRKFAAVTVVVSLLLAGVGTFGMTKVSTEFSFLDFVPTTSPLRGTALTLTERFNFPETTSVLVDGDVAAGRSWNALLMSSVASAQVENVQSIVTASGVAFPTGRSLTSVIAQWIDPTSEIFDEQLGGIARELGLNQNLLAPPDADLTKLYDAAVAKDPITMSGVLAVSGNGYISALYNFDTTAGESGAGPLAEGLNKAFTPATEAGLDAISTSGAIISDLIIQTLRDSQVTSLILTLGAALLLLVFNFWFELRRPMLGVITTVPVAIVVVWVFGLMALFGIPFGPVTATISALGIGIGIPYMIHVTHRYLEERVQQESPDTAITETLTHTGGALAGSAITTIAGFGILVTSTAIPFRQFGFVIAYTILLALIAAVLVLPSMLVLWDRWHRDRGEDLTESAILEAAFHGDG